MALETIPAFEGKVALVTRKGSDSRVIHHVSLQLKLPFELLATGMTIELHLITVNSLVIYHVLFLSKPSSTYVTDPGLLSCMASLVELKLASADKPLLTEVTGPGFLLSGVGLFLVSGYTRLHGEALATYITDIRSFILV